MNQGNINISVTGGEEKGREIVTSVLANALVSQGFTNVAQISHNGEPIVGTDVPTALDSMRSVNPNFLETKIQVIGIPSQDIENAPAKMTDGTVATAVRFEGMEGESDGTMIIVADAAA